MDCPDALALPAGAETWDMPTPYPDATFHTVNISEFASDVSEATDGGRVAALLGLRRMRPHTDSTHATPCGRIRACVSVCTRA